MQLFAGSECDKVGELLQNGHGYMYQMLWKNVLQVEQGHLQVGALTFSLSCQNKLKAHIGIF